MKKLLSVLLVVVFLVVTPANVFAANPFKDVTKSSVDSASYSAIVYVKAHKGWNGLTSKGKVKPNAYMKRWEFIKMLYYMYGEKFVPSSIWDSINANMTCDSKYVINKYVELSKKLGYPIKWSGNSTKMKRKDVARYAKIFGTYHKKLAPKR